MKIPNEDVQIREYSDIGRGYTIVVASARYARGVKVYQETIDDFGPGLIGLARSQAIELLTESPIPYRVGDEVFLDVLELPEPKVVE